MKFRSALGLTVVALLSFALVSCADDGAAGSPLDVRSAAMMGDVAATAHPGDTIEFVATEFAFSPNDVVADPGDYHGVLVNDGTMVHDIKFGDGQVVSADPGARGSSSTSRCPTQECRSCAPSPDTPMQA